MPDLMFERQLKNRSALCLISFYYFFVCVAGYNLDTKFPIFFSSSPNNYFGFSVALHRNRDGPIALVGAPRANSTVLMDQIYQPGVLFSCSISFSTSVQTCREVVLDKYGNTYTHRGNNLSYLDKKDNMWLGVSMDVQQNSAQNDIVICGHLWKNQYYSQHYLANGVCYVINSDLDPRSVKKLVPFVHKSKQSRIPPGVYYYAFGQVGTSAAYSEDGKQLLLGAPGFYDWTGTILSYSFDSKKRDDEYVNPIIPEPPGDQNISPESYIGYSLTSGKFFDSNENFVAVGAPRDGNSHGRVYIFKSMKPTAKKLFVHQRKEGLQFGEYFGAAVLAINLNNDQYTDLLVGAPFASSESGGDEGKVYVYISNGMGLQIFTELTGENKPNSQFGIAIANVGDLNQDGFNDVAIGAPYEDKNGAVYIYHGTHDGIKTQYIQRISAGETRSSLSGFGIHISRGLDVDNNQYPDILIGAYASSEAVLLRTRPVVQISPKLSFSPQQIIKNVTSCVFQGQNVSCVNVTSCINYAGKHVPLTLEFSTIISIEHWSQSNHISGRGFFLQNGKPTSVIQRQVDLVIGIDNCVTDLLFIHPDIRDQITPIQVLYDYNMIQLENAKFCKMCPVIDPSSSTNLTKSISFQTGCGRDDKCLSDLVVKARVLGNPRNQPLIIGENETLVLDIEVTNIGDPAYLAELLIYLPADTPSRNQHFCSQLNDQQKQRSNASLVCNLGDPLLKEKLVQIKIDISKLSADTKSINLILEASTASTEVNPVDNSLKIPISFKSVADISITGSPSQQQITYIEDTEDLPMSISHTYFVMNHGPSPLQIIDIILYVPMSFPGMNGLVNFLSFTNLEADSGEPFTIPAKCNDTDLVLKPISPERKKPQGEIFGEDDLIERGKEMNGTTTIVYSEDMRKLSDSDENQVNSRAKKRTERNSPSNKKKKDVSINCETAHCMVIHCTASQFINSRSFARIKISAEVNFTVLNDVLEPWYKMEFITAGEVFIRDDNGNIQPEHNHPDKTQVKTVIVQAGPPPSEEVAKWIIFVSIGVGIFLLIIIMIVLIKIGFFRRQQKEKIRQMMTQGDVKETEPYLMNDEFETSEGE